MTRLLLLLAAGCSATASSPTVTPAPQPPPAPIGDAIAGLRAQGPAALDRLLADYDQMDAADPGRARLEATIDAVAAQRYAHVSRLYWYTDLAAAVDAAADAGKPILSLRMLGRLDQDWSCANSRFFRVALYANQQVAAYLRDHFILHWSTEREVPVVTVDFGDGRKLQTTIAGNSAHYVLDARGRPVDALPGLWGPTAFVAELTAAEPVAIAAAALEGEARAEAIGQHHSARMLAAQQRWAADGSARLALGGLPEGDPSLMEAERITVTKSRVESPMVTGLRLGREVARVADDSAVWEQIGAAHADESRLDAASIALMSRLSGKPTLAAGFEKMMAGDTALNRYKIRWPIHQWFVAHQPETLDLHALNAKVYKVVFLTPASDPWLGMSTPDVFTGLPGDGIIATR